MLRYFASLLLIITIITGCGPMLELSDNFQAQLDDGGKPAHIVHVQETVIEAEKTLEADWTANSAESNVDYTSSPPNAGDVILANASSLEIVENFETGGDAWQGGQDYEGGFGQGFKVAHNYSISKISLYLQAYIGLGNGTIKIKIYSGWNGSTGTLIATSDNVVISETASWYDFTISAELTGNTQYTFISEFVSGNTINTYIDLDDGYSDGTLWIYEYVGATWGWDEKTGRDAYFRIYGGYKSSGYLTTDNFDLGSTPTASGEWQMQDTKPDGTALTYEAWSSATGVFGGEQAYLGTVADGDSITDLKEYYRVKPSFAANTARDETPTLHSIKADFSTYKIFTDCLRIAQENDYEMGLMPISGISSEINDFKESTIGQITPTLDFNESVSKYLYGKYPKNKIIKVLIGFDDLDFTVSDFLEFFRGQIVDYTITSDDKVDLITQAFQVEWSKKIPETWEDTGDDVTWTDMHPTDVMLDIIRNYMDVRDSKIVASSFADVKALIPSFRVTRTITKEPVEAKKLMEELRLLTGCYFLPSSAGKIKIKRFDSTEAVVVTLTDDNTKGTSYKGNLKSLINKTLVYYGHDGEGDDAADYTELQLDVSTGATSNENWGEWKTKEIKDKWTLAADSAQVISMSDAQLARYKDPPAIIQRVGDKKLLYIEAGDMVAVTIKRAPSADGVSGIVDKKFQVIRPALDFKGNKVTLTLLEA